MRLSFVVVLSLSLTIISCINSASTGVLLEKNGSSSSSSPNSNNDSNNSSSVAASNAGEFGWIKQLGVGDFGANANSVTGFEACQKIAIDNDNNIYCVGSTPGSLGEANGGIGYDGFILKINSDQSFGWIKQLGSGSFGANAVNKSGYDHLYDIAIDSTGNLIAVGSTNGSLGESNGGSDDAYILKLQADGTFSWIKQIGNGAYGQSVANNRAGNESCSRVAIDSSDNIYCAGKTFGQPFLETSGGMNDIFITKMSSAGTHIWTKHLGAGSYGANVNSTSGTELVGGLVIDENDNVYIGGTTSGNFMETAGGNGDLYFLKLNSDGDILAKVHLGGGAYGSNVNSTSGMETFGNMVYKDGYIYATGITESNMGETKGGLQDIFVMKIASSDLSFQWLKQLGTGDFGANANATGSLDYSKDITIDENNNLYITGYTYSAYSEVIGGGADAFIMKMGIDGSFSWIKQLGGGDYGSNVTDTTDQDECNGIAVDSFGNVYCAGGTESSLGESVSNSEDVFVWKVGNL